VSDDLRLFMIGIVGLYVSLSVFAIFTGDFLSTVSVFSILVELFLNVLNDLIPFGSGGSPPGSSLI